MPLEVYVPPTDPRTSDKVVQDQLKEAELILRQMAVYLRTSTKEKRFSRCQSFVKWAIRERLVREGRTVKELVIGCFLARWTLVPLDPTKVADYFGGVPLDRAKLSSTQWYQTYDDFWRNYSLDIKFQKRYYTLYWARDAATAYTAEPDQFLQEAMKSQIPLSNRFTYFIRSTDDARYIHKHRVDESVQLQPCHEYVLSRTLAPRWIRSAWSWAKAHPEETAIFVVYVVAVIVAVSVVFMLLVL